MRAANFLQGLAKGTRGPQRGLLERWRKGHGVQRTSAKALG